MDINNNLFNALCRELPNFVDIDEYIKNAIDMDIKEIDKKLQDKNISKVLRLALEKRKEILINNKEVKK